MVRPMLVVTLFLAICTPSSLRSLSSLNSGRMLKQEASEPHSAPSESAPAMQDTSDVAMPSVESPSSDSNAETVRVVVEATSMLDGEGSATTASHNVNSASCDILRRFRAISQRGRIAVIPNTESERACCELCRSTPNSACRSWFRMGRSQNHRCYLSSLA